jgi:hypothetical protein
MAKTTKTAAKKAAAKAPAKAAKAPAALKPIKDPLSKSSLVSHIVEQSGVDSKSVKAVLASLEGAISASVHKKGAGTFTLPGLL